MRNTRVSNSILPILYLDCYLISSKHIHRFTKRMHIATSIDERSISLDHCGS